MDQYWDIEFGHANRISDTFFVPEIRETHENPINVSDMLLEQVRTFAGVLEGLN